MGQDGTTSNVKNSGIDKQLQGQLDFRENKFGVCFKRKNCTVNGYKINGYHRHSDADAWHSAPLYWDPIDGIGILGGGQDDEIDINERLIVEFPYQRKVVGIWLTDLFLSETKRYASLLNKGDEEVRQFDQDFEEAEIELRLNKKVNAKLRVTGNLALPNISFNETIDPSLFDSGNDLRQRLVVQDEDLYILSSETGAKEKIVLNPVLLGQLDTKKRNLFNNTDEDKNKTQDLLKLYSDDLDVELYPEGDRNAQRIAEILGDPKILDSLRQSAQIGRTVDNVPNGEVSANLTSPVDATSVMFYASTRTSNDFSIAGIIFPKGE
jgi:hypothetical protein